MLLDTSNYEAVSIGGVMNELLMRHFLQKPDEAPIMLPMKMDMPMLVQKVLIICTTGCFMQENMLTALMAAAAASVKFLLIIGTDNFRFPTPQFLVDHRPIAERLSLDSNLVIQLIAEVFKCIACTFDPSGSTAESLVTKALEIANRLAKDSALKKFGNHYSSLRYRF
jgi:hypothetical protein